MNLTKTYTAALAKGNGLVRETLLLLEIWEPGMSPGALAHRVLAEGLLGKATANRVNDVVKRVFAPRYLHDAGKPAYYLKTLLKEGVAPDILRQLLFLYTARANPVLHDFVIEVYWSKYAMGQQILDSTEARAFLESVYNQGKIPQKWNKTLTARVANGLCGCLADFGLLETKRKPRRAITPISISPLTSLYLAHELHFSGLSDASILSNSDWLLFGLQRLEVLRELQKVAPGYFILQFSGELVRISWQYQSMEEFLRAWTRREFQRT